MEEFESVAARSRKENVRYHFGHLAQLVHEKHSELDESKRKFKARVVFRGDAVKNEDGLQAVFSEQGSSACLISGVKVLDAVARLPGNSGEERDGQQAYIQAPLGGNPTYVFLPKDQWPADWHQRFKRPVVRLRLALYGHPLAGLFWEKHASEAVQRCGFRPVPDWECMYYHADLRLMLAIYVDDFKLVGQSSSLSRRMATFGEGDPVRRHFTAFRVPWLQTGHRVRIVTWSSQCSTDHRSRWHPQQGRRLRRCYYSADSTSDRARATCSSQFSKEWATFLTVVSLHHDRLLRAMR